MLSGTAQFLGWMGLPLVPVAITWLAVAGEEPAPGIDGGILVGRGSPPADRHPVNAFACTIRVASVDDCVAKALAAGGALALPER
jgi:hypothetical protein